MPDTLSPGCYMIADEVHVNIFIFKRITLQSILGKYQIGWIILVIRGQITVILRSLLNNTANSRTYIN